MDVMLFTYMYEIDTYIKILKCQLCQFFDMRSTLLRVMTSYRNLIPCCHILLNIYISQFILPNSMYKMLFSSSTILPNLYEF